ncbi:hypothetical protein D3C72_1111380 [compost metagenome]
MKTDNDHTALGPKFSHVQDLLFLANVRANRKHSIDNDLYPRPLNALKGRLHCYSSLGGNKLMLNAIEPLRPHPFRHKQSPTSYNILEPSHIDP